MVFCIDTLTFKIKPATLYYASSIFRLSMCYAGRLKERGIPEEELEFYVLADMYRLNQEQYGGKVYPRIIEDNAKRAVEAELSNSNNLFHGMRKRGETLLDVKLEVNSSRRKPTGGSSPRGRSSKGTAKRSASNGRARGKAA
jgi:hypothetical protein